MRRLMLMLLLLFVGVVLLILVSQWFRWPGAIQPGGVMLCILLFNTPVDTYVSYALNRIFDTSIGVFAALAVSWLIPRGGLQTWKYRIARWRANYHAGAHGYHPDHHEAPDVAHVEAMMEAAREDGMEENDQQQSPEEIAGSETAGS